MEKNTRCKSLDQFSWFGDLSDPQFNQILPILQLRSNPKIEIYSEINYESLQFDVVNEMQVEKQQIEKITSRTKLTHDQSSGNLSGQQQQKRQQAPNKKRNNQHKQDKQHVYSKTYRQRKKQMYKTLKDQNEFLKKRINQLEYRLREQEIELNRFKFPPPQKELNLDQIRKEFVQKAVIVVNQHKFDPTQNSKIVYTPQDSFYQVFLDGYDKNGFAGTNKTNLLNYHFNQILQTALLDSQRYLTLMFAQSKNWQHLQPLQGYDSLHATFYDVAKLEQNHANLNQRLIEFKRNLYPLLLQVNQHISSLYRQFQSLLESNQKIHNFLRQKYVFNMDVVMKRLELQVWFQFHKYSKIMRRLRSQWLDFIKKGAQEKQQIKAQSRATKRKKVEKDTQ